MSGAGFVGAGGTASTCADLGIAVTLVDPLPQPMSRVLGEGIGALLGEVHRERGIAVHCGVGVDELLATSGRLTGARLGDGSVIAADVALIGIGSVPNVDWLEGSGLRLDNGVVCDERCRAFERVYAAGDVASWHDVASSTRLRIEHRMHAAEQGAYVAQAILARGDLAPFATVPLLLVGPMRPAHPVPRPGLGRRPREDRGGHAGRTPVRWRPTSATGWWQPASSAINMPRETRQARALLGQQFVPAGDER